MFAACRDGAGLILKFQERVVHSGAGTREQLLKFTGIKPKAAAAFAEVNIDTLEMKDEQANIALGTYRNHIASRRMMPLGESQRQAHLCRSSRAEKCRQIRCGTVRMDAMSEIKATVESMDWESWSPTEYANLCFVIRDGQILLIRKKRGLGAGKINGPGGRIEKGETALAAAIRETQEEIGVTPLDLEQVGELFFQFLDGYKLHVAVFRADDCTGNLCETDEATPMWVDLGQIPYHEMWQDDPHWLPFVLSGKSFRGYFIFDGERLVDHRIEHPRTSPLRSP